MVRYTTIQNDNHEFPSMLSKGMHMQQKYLLLAPVEISSAHILQLSVHKFISFPIGKIITSFPGYEVE